MIFSERLNDEESKYLKVLSEILMLSAHDSAYMKEDTYCYFTKRIWLDYLPTVAYMLQLDKEIVMRCAMVKPEFD